MRYLMLAAACAVTGCSGLHSEISPPPPELRSTYRLESARGGYRDIELTRTTFGPAAFVRGPWQAAWTALPAIYAELGIEGSGVMNQDDHLFGRRGMPARGRLETVRMSRVLRCGSLHLGGEDRFNLTMTVMTELVPSAGGSTVRTWVDASGRDATGPGSPPVQCASTGWLEGEIARRLQERAGTARTA
jgi:hypothetical protein